MISDTFESDTQPSSLFSFLAQIQLFNSLDEKNNSPGVTQSSWAV